VLAWAGEKPPEEDLVTYPETFAVAGLGDELVIAEALAKIQAPSEMRKEHMLIILEKMFPQVTVERWESLKASVENWEILTPLQLAKETQSMKPQSGTQATAAPKRQGSVTADTK
jgi:hypothetical protein